VNDIMEIDASGKDYKSLNHQIREIAASGVETLVLTNIIGQRYLGSGIKDELEMVIEGVPGNDLGAFMDGPVIKVKGNAQDLIGNTMNAGKIIIYGDAGDVVGYGMRGGKLFIRGDVGYRVGIHMKSYSSQVPVIVIGGSCGDFLGEYMAGGVLIVLGIHDLVEDKDIIGRYIGTGMHGGVIYIRGKVETHQLGKGVVIRETDENDKKNLEKYLSEFCKEFGFQLKGIFNENFIKLVPASHRPYGDLYD